MLELKNMSLKAEERHTEKENMSSETKTVEDKVRCIMDVVMEVL